MLSKYDETFLNKDQQSQINNLNKMLETNPEQLTQVHNAVETIRATQGYSGGIEGNEYLKLETPTIPQIPDFSGFGSMPTFNMETTDYSSNVKKSINAIKNQMETGFEYDSSKDESFLAFKNQMERMGNQAYSNDIARQSARTGGTESSWGQAVASQSRNAMLQKATDSIPQFEQLAYGKYQGSLNDQFNLLKTYQQEDETLYNRAYNEYKSNVDSYLNDLDLAEVQYNKEIDSYNIAIDSQKTEISEAQERMNILGYVSNQDASILGLPAGTLSKDARERIEEYEDYLKKSKQELANYEAKLIKSNAYARSQAIWEKENLETSNGTTEEVPDDFNITDKERKAVEDFKGTLNRRMDSILSGITDKYNIMDEEKATKMVNAELNSMISDLSSAMLSVGDVNEQYIEASKMNNLLNSTYFNQYATDEMKKDKKLFVKKFNELYGIKYEKKQAEDAWME